MVTPAQVANNAEPLYIIALINKVCELMGGRWVYQQDCNTWVAEPGDIDFILAAPWQRKQAEYERAIMPRISIGVGDSTSDLIDPNGLNDLVETFEWTLQVAQRLTAKDALGYSQITMWRIKDIGDYLAARLNRTRLTADEIGVTEIVRRTTSTEIAQERLDHYSVTYTGRTRLKINAQRDLMTTEEFRSRFEQITVDDPDAPRIESIGVEVVPVDSAGTPITTEDREALRRMERR